MNKAAFVSPTSSSQKTVVVGMSGGVDSSVTAALLKAQGYNVIGMFMKNWEELSDDETCSSAQDYEDVVKVCSKLCIPYYAINFAQEYKDLVFAHFLQELEKGNTPNPDILCNRYIKFTCLLDTALSLGADFLATGHYAQNIQDDSGSHLLKGKDPGKDQTYFLYTLNQEILSKVLFPVGSYPKSRVREIAKELGLATAEKKDSTGICFIGKRNFRQFLNQHLAYQPGDYEKLDGTKIGNHLGVAYYTIGQRRGTNIGGKGQAWFVVGKDVARGVVFVEQGARHPALFADELTAVDAFWVKKEPPKTPYACRAKIRYRQPDQPCTIVSNIDGTLHVQFDVPQRAITAQQSIVFYQGDECLGGAIIQSRGPSYYEMKKAVPAEVTS